MIAVPPLVCRFLAEAALRSADTPLRDNGRTRHTPTARKRVSEGSSGMYSPDAVYFLAPTESSLETGYQGTSSLRHCDHIMSEV